MITRTDLKVNIRNIIENAGPIDEREKLILEILKEIDSFLEDFGQGILECFELEVNK